MYRRVRTAVTGLLLAVAGIAALVVALVVYGALTGGGSIRRAESGVCRTWSHGFAGLGGLEWGTDIGSAPIPSPRHLLCLSDLGGVKGKTIGIRVFRDADLAGHENLVSSHNQRRSR
jgi:hypothetical protein